MKVGFTLPIVGPAITGADGLSAFCGGLEDLGYDTLTVGDRLAMPVTISSDYPGGEPPQIMRRYLDPVLLWTVAATSTKRMRLNASTLNLFYWEPVHLARVLTTFDVLSGGRVDVGVGLGWMREEYEVSRGADWHKRGAMLDEMLAFLHTWWTTNPVSFEGEFVAIQPLHADLRPVQPGGPPIWIGGASKAAMRRLGRVGSGWLGYEWLPKEEADKLWSVARAAAEDAGRDPDALKMSLRMNLERGVSVDTIAAKLTRIAESGAGDEVVMDGYDAFDSLETWLDFAGRLMERIGRL
jgi:probable F420-dependent oxidoreductase